MKHRTLKKKRFFIYMINNNKKSGYIKSHEFKPKWHLTTKVIDKDCFKNDKVL